MATCGLQYRRWIEILACVVALTAACPPIAASAQSPFWADLASPGTFSVGFRVIPMEDEARPYLELSARPLPVYLWYPAAGTGPHVPYGRYVELMADEAALGDAGEQERRGRRERWEAGLDRRHARLGERMSNLPTAAMAGADQAGGTFPLVVYVPGAGGSALENVALAELLASHGYVVAAFPSVGTQTRLIRTNRRDLEAQVQDIRFILGQVTQLPGVRADRAVVAGWSWGGLAAMIAQMRDRRIGAVVSIDGSIAFHRGIANRLQDFGPDRADVPYLMFVAGDRSGETPGFVDEMRYSDRIYVSLAAAEHSDFTTRWGFLANQAREGTDDFDPSVVDTYRIFLRGTAAFVDETLRETPDIGGTVASTLEAAGAPDALHTKGLPAPPSNWRFLQILRDSTEQGLARYAALKHQNPSLRLFEEEDLVELAFQIFNALDRPDDAVAVGRLMVEEHPNSYSAHGSLAELYRKHEEWASALVEFAAAAALAAERDDPVATFRSDDLDYYRKMVGELVARLSG